MNEQFAVDVPEDRIKYGLCVDVEGGTIVAYVFDTKEEADDWLTAHPGEPKGAAYIKEVVALPDLGESLADEAATFLTE